MRQYRGIRKDNNEWVYGYYVKVMDREGDDIDLICSVDTSYPRINGKWYLEDTVEVVPETVGQSTGLNDKNGKEIYGEGDIYKDADGIISIVKMAVDGWALFPVKKETPVRNLYWRNICNKTKGEIIGDIHTTPELSEKP